VVIVYVSSLEKGSGKTAIIAGLGKYLQNEDKKIGYYKPLISKNSDLTGKEDDSDAVFLQKLFSLSNSMEDISPVIEDTANLNGKILDTFTRVSKNKDVVFIEDTGEYSRESYKIAKSLDARILFVEKYLDQAPDTNLMDICKSIKDDLLGVVFNKIPVSQTKHIQDDIMKVFKDSGIDTFGALPEDKMLLAFTVGELAGYLNGEIINNSEKSDELVENIMLGAMTADAGPLYFDRKTNKAVILRSERPDMQMAALETTTRAMVLSGDTEPHQSVRYQAESKKVPLITTKENILPIITDIEEAFSKARFNQEYKLARIVELMEKSFDFPAVYKTMSIES